MAVHHATIQALFHDTVVTSSREEYAAEMVEIFLAGIERRRRRRSVRIVEEARCIARFVHSTVGRVAQLAEQVTLNH